MISIETESLLTLNEARRLAWMRGRNGNSVALETINRWRLRGIRGVLLESVKIGGTVFTSNEATLRFISQLNADRRADPAPIPRRREIATADKKLDDAGIS